MRKPDLLCNNEDCGWKGSVNEGLWDRKLQKRKCPKCESTNITDNRFPSRTTARRYQSR